MTQQGGDQEALASLARRHHRDLSGGEGVSLGLEELIATDEARDLEIATSLAADPERVARLRAGMRPRLLASPLSDAPALARRLETAYRGRFSSSKAVGAHFGITPKKYQSGETDITGGISKVGDAMVRMALYEAAQVMLTRTTRFSTLKRWAMQVAQRRGMKRAIVALSRKLATVLHRMWVDGTDFRFGKEVAGTA